MGKTGALDKTNPARAERDGNIAIDRSLGSTYNELSRKYNVSTSTVHRILQDDEVRDVIEAGSRAFASLVPVAVAKHEQIITGEDAGLALRASQNVLNATGIMPSHTQSIVISNSFNKQSIEFTPEVVSLLAHANGSAPVPALGLPDIVEAEYDNASDDYPTNDE